MIHCLRERRKQKEVSKDEDLYLDVTRQLQGRMGASQGEWNRKRFKAFSDIMRGGMMG